MVMKMQFVFHENGKTNNEPILQKVQPQTTAKITRNSRWELYGSLRTAAKPCKSCGRG